MTYGEIANGAWSNKMYLRQSQEPTRAPTHTNHYFAQFVERLRNVSPSALIAMHDFGHFNRPHSPMDILGAIFLTHSHSVM